MLLIFDEIANQPVSIYDNYIQVSSFELLKLLALAISAIFPEKNYAHSGKQKLL